MYISLHNHTHYSNIRMLDCIIKPKDLVNKAINLGYKGIAITDHECLSSAIDLLKIRDNILKEHPDFKIIIGNEIYLIDEQNIHQNTTYYHFILLAKDIEGWKQLKELSSRAWERSYVEKGLRRCPTTYKDIEDIVSNNKGHLLCSTACLGGELGQKILNHDVTGSNSFIRWCIENFGKENVALEIQPSDSEEQIKVNNVICKFSKFYSLPCIVTTDSHYLDKEDFSIHSAFLNSKESSDRETEKFYKYTYVMSEDEIREILKRGQLSEEDIDKAISNTISFTQDVENFDFRSQTIVPCLKLDDFKLDFLLKDWFEKYPSVKLFYESSSDQDRYLMYLIEKGLNDKKIKITEEIVSRINEELDTINYISIQLKQSISGYLNLVKEIVDICWEVTFLGAGRGSSGCFLINYLIGITQTNPMDYNIPSFRFLNKARADALPDVDIDISPKKTDEVFNLLQEKFGHDNVINCATFKTESLKAAILTAAKGLGYNNDDAQKLTALVPSKRGITYTLKDCLEGDEEKGYEPVPNFEKQLREYPGIFEAVEKIEGLSMNPSIHASAVYIFTEGYLAQNSLMRAPNGTPITAFNMHDSDEMGALKFDLLRTDAESKLMKTMDLLIKDKQIEWQGSLRKTYDMYMHPQKLLYDCPEMWKNLSDGRYSDIFQLDTAVGKIGVEKMKPQSISELADVNGLIRLQVESGQESPVDRYVKFKNDVSLWYKEMCDYNLTDYEQYILRGYLINNYGIAYSQEDLMRILMDSDIANFTLGQADKARKIIAKKHINDIEQLKKDYFASDGGRKEFKEYVWDKMISPQLGYSFNLAHGVSYSLIALQEMNLAYRYNPLYWACACLCVNSGNSDTDFEQDDEEEEEILTNEKNKSATPNYGKIAKSISDAQLLGVNIELPNINTSQEDFIPDIKNNSILYSMLAINVVNQDLMDRIIQGRPFKSLNDFILKVQPTQNQMLGLIKSGCFDELENKDRNVILQQYLYTLAEQLHPVKEQLTETHLKKIFNSDIKGLDQYQQEIKVFKFKKYIDKNCIEINSKPKRYLLTEESCIKFFKNYLESYFDITAGEYSYLPNGTIGVKFASFEKKYKIIMEKVKKDFNTEEGRRIYAEKERQDFVEELKNKYCRGTKASWEMETMCFYHEPHELYNINETYYQICNFNNLSETPQTESYVKNGKTFQSIKTYAVAGTVIDSNNTKHIVSLSTKYGVIDIKFYDKQYVTYNQKISVIDPSTNVKDVIDDTWFKRGTKLIIYGYRRENMFVCKTDYSSGYARTVGLIENIKSDGFLDIRYKRNKK